MAELTEKVAEAAEEVAEQAVNVAEVTRTLRKGEMLIVCGGLGLGFVIGATAGYLYAKRQLETKYDKMVGKEIEEMRTYYASKLEAVTERAQKPPLDQVVTDLGYVTPPRENPTQTEDEINDEIDLIETERALREEEEETSRNVFTDGRPSEDIWDYAAEIRNRTADSPYVIHLDEHTQNEKEYIQTTLTYYEEDDVLADEHDHIIEDKDETVGDHNLLKFGHGSNDVNVVYVRNDVIEMDIEVLRSNGSYAEEVHGLKHMDAPPRRRNWDG